MQFWLVAGFIGPLGGFLLGIVITFLIFKRFASVRNFFFESLVSLKIRRVRVKTALSFAPSSPAGFCEPYRVSSTAPKRERDWILIIALDMLPVINIARMGTWGKGQVDSYFLTMRFLMRF